jgi:RNA polymerase sigma-70 factor, ECF subfamily
VENQIDTGKLYEDFSKPLKAFIQKRVNDSALAEDLLHDVFLKIHNQIDSVKDTDKLASWIYRIAQNSIIDSFRKKKEMIPHEEDPMIAAPDQVNDAAERLAPTLKRMVGQLPAKYKEAIWLADFEGVQQTQLAKRWSISISAAKSRVQRARKMLKDLLLQCCHFEFDRYGTVFDYRSRKCTNCCEKSQC